MSMSLFDKIHNDAYLNTREAPASIEEFVEFGLQPKDYVQYVGLQHVFQGELLLYGFPKSSTLERLFHFCEEKNLISLDRPDLLKFDRNDAEYYHGWLQYPKDPAEFRLCIERKLSSLWDEEEAYVMDVFGTIHLTYDFDHGTSSVHIKKYDADRERIFDASRKEVIEFFYLSQEEKRKIEREVDEHLEKMPSEHSATAILDGIPWLKGLWKLWDRQRIIDEICIDIENALGSLERLYTQLESSDSDPNAYIFKDTDILYVHCENNTCAENDHLLKDVCVEFSFYNKPNKQYMIHRCSHCRQFQLTLQELDSIFEIYGVPQARIIYSAGEDADLSGFSEDSMLYKMGYSVSQSVGLSAEERQNILMQAIKSGKMSKFQVLSFLRRRININGMKEGNEVALCKWKADYDFINNQR